MEEMKRRKADLESEIRRCVFVCTGGHLDTYGETSPQALVCFLTYSIARGQGPLERWLHFSTFCW